MRHGLYEAFEWAYFTLIPSAGLAGSFGVGVVVLFHHLINGLISA